MKFGWRIVTMLLFFLNALEIKARDQLINKVEELRPLNLLILNTRSEVNGTYLLGMYSLMQDSVDPNLKTYKLWREQPNDFKIHSEFVRCNQDEPLRVKRDSKSIYIRRINPGGNLTRANYEDHLVWWAACFPELAGIDPKTLSSKAIEMGFSTNLLESSEALSTFGR